MVGFKENNYYLYRPSTMKVQGPYVSRKSAEDDFEDGDTLLLALPCKTTKTCKSATVDFNKKLLTIQGSFKEYLSGTYEIPDSMLSTVLTELYNVCKDVTIIGVPPLQGECLDEMLHM